MILSPPPNFSAQLSPGNALFVRYRGSILRRFYFHMRRLTWKNCQVIRVIVMFVPVKMMNNFAFHQCTTKFFCGNNAVNRGAPNLQILFGIHSLVILPTPHRTVFTLTVSFLRCLDIKLNPAMNALCNTSLLARFRITYLRTPSRFAGLSADFTCIHGNPPFVNIIPHNADKTTHWFSPHCGQLSDLPLFGGA